MVRQYSQRHAKRDLRTLKIVLTQISPYTILKTAKRNPIMYKASNIMCFWCDKCQKVQTLIRRRVRDAAAGLGLHFLRMSEGPFSHDAGHITEIYLSHNLRSGNRINALVQYRFLFPRISLITLLQTRHK